MQLNDSFTVHDLIVAIGLAENSDRAAQAVAAQTVSGVETWPTEMIAQLLDELADGMSLADPYRAGLIAWMCGCLLESGHSTPRSRGAIMDWLESVLTLAGSLYDRVCERLPQGELSATEDFQNMRETLRPVMPVEHRAWESLERSYAAATSLMAAFREHRRAARHLFELARKVARQHPTVRHLRDLIRVPCNESFLILEPDRKRGMIALVDGVESMAEFFPAILNAFGTFNDPDLYRTHGWVDLSKPGSASSSPEKPVFLTHWTAWHWTALRDEGTLPVMNQAPWLEIVGRDRLFAEQQIWEPRPFAGYRVVLLQATNVRILLSFPRNYPQLRPEIRVEQLLSAEETQAWVTRIAGMNRANRQGARPDGHDEALKLLMAEGLVAPLQGTWHDCLLARAVRRMVPVARQHWAPLPPELLEQLLRVLTGIESHVFAGAPFPAEALEPAAVQVLDRAVRADRSRLVSPQVVGFVEATRVLAQRLAHPEVPAGFDQAILRSVFEVWNESVQRARLAGHTPDVQQLQANLRADRDLLVSLSAKGERPWHDERLAALAELWPAGRPEWWPMLPEYPVPGLDYEIAISFAGEDREHARALAAALVRRGCRVFIDESRTSELVGRELSPLLRSVFRDRSLYCVVLISAAYASKTWTMLEWAAAREREGKNGGDYILPVRLDDTELPGLAETVAYLDLRTIPVEQVHAAIAQRLQSKITQQLGAGRLVAPRGE